MTMADIHPNSSPPRAAKWEDFGDMLTPRDLKELLHVRRTSTLTLWCQIGQLPKAVVRRGNIVLWRKQDVIDHLALRKRMEDHQQ